MEFGKCMYAFLIAISYIFYLPKTGILKIISFFYNPALYISKKIKARDFTRNLWLLLHVS